MTRTPLYALASLRIIIPFLLVLSVVALYIRTQMAETKEDLPFRQEDHRKQTFPVISLIISLLAIYLLVYVYLTFLCRRPTRQPEIDLTPFWSYREAIQFSPFTIKRLGLAREILLNILLTVPLGLLLPLLFYRRKHPYLLTLLLTLVLSLLTETLQYFFHLGFCETDDVFNNLLGGLLGITILSAGTKLSQKTKRSDEDKSLTHKNTQQSEDTDISQCAERNQTK